ncbi:ribosome biogenesis protein Nop16 [Syncephalis pseudoplumigaleata]|uniref:Nucleolar protein 16 n=1 Tax=Syncephalis pseudoplumigaleata TaxID=1712513 RepID=A0A4P9YY66_9FUNG|nr:ribosome biogenesis protein Nop16 [Syncephalis pseudoplumigaleata]|eukprot:RKP24281.1 ribosome biogenesis protein Nop16 [Syncephalis pseudoplumigaleata]
MGKRPHARRVNRQPTQKNTRRVANRVARKRPIAQDKLVAAHWDKELTVRQNYARLGLAHRVNGVAGGTERSRALEEMLAYRAADAQDLSKLDEATLKRRLGPGRAMIKRDDKGNIISVIMGTEADLDDGSEEQEEEQLAVLSQAKAKSQLVEEMERQVAEHVPYQRFLSPGETKWAKEVIAKYGDQYERAFRDLKLNKLQRTVGQIRQLCERYLATQQAAQ